MSARKTMDDLACERGDLAAAIIADHATEVEARRGDNNRLLFDCLMFGEELTWDPDRHDWDGPIVAVLAMMSNGATQERDAANRLMAETDEQSTKLCHEVNARTKLAESWLAAAEAGAKWARYCERWAVESDDGPGFVAKLEAARALDKSIKDGKYEHDDGHYHRGHAVIEVDGVMVYADTGQPVAESKERDCGYCGLANTPEGHDGCLGTLPGVLNACCGHGRAGDVYIQFGKKGGES